jgi:hypothetical protein
MDGSAAFGTHTVLAEADGGSSTDGLADARLDAQCFA